jgi:chromosome partitioning protein
MGDARAVAVTCLKGGVGKSTTAINTARELVERGRSTLLVDLDPNGHASLSLGLRERYTDDAGSLGDVLLDDADPDDRIVSTAYGDTERLDVLPATGDLEELESRLSGAMMPSAQLRRGLVEPLLGDVYDHVVIDCPAARGLLQNNALYAARNMLLPLRPESGAISGLTATTERLVEPAREHFDLDLLAFVPTDLHDRLDQRRATRRLIEPLATRDHLRPKLPNFAYVDPDFFDAVDRGEWDGPLPKPGVRRRAAIDALVREQAPLRDHDPSCDQLPCYEELAEIVVEGGVSRDV